MREFLANFWSDLFDKLGLFGLVIASSVPIILVLIVILAVALIKALFGRCKPKDKPEKPSQRPREEPKKAPKDPEKLYQMAEDLLQKGWDNVPEAFPLYLQAAKQGHYAAQGRVGRIYYYGNGIRPDKEEGLFWLRKSAEQGGIYARLWLGRIYEEKRFEDPGEVLDWLIPIAEDGDAEAQYLLSRMYSLKCEHREKTLGYGPGQWKEDELCVQWYRQSDHWLELAAKNGYEKAQDLYW